MKSIKNLGVVKRIVLNSLFSVFVVLMIFSVGFSLELKAKSKEKEIKDFFLLMEETIVKKDSAKLIGFYSNKDLSFFKEKTREINSYKHIKDLMYKIIPERIEVNGNKAVVLVSNKISYKQHNRVLGDFYWTNNVLRKEGKDWKIVKEENRDFIKPIDIKLNVELLPDKGLVKGSAIIKYEVLQSFEKSLAIKLNRGLKIDKMTDEKGQKLLFDRLGGVAVISLNKILKKKDQGIINIEYSGSFFNESKESGYSQVCIDSSGSFASWVTRWYPMIANESTKCSGTIKYTLPKGLKVASSGLFKGIKKNGDKEIHTFKINQPLNFSFAAAKYFHQSKIIDGIEVAVYFLEGGEKKAKFYIEECSKMIAFFKTVYGMYPYDKYAVVEIWKDKVGGLGGSSEQGMNLFPTGILPDDDSYEFVIGHEIGHSWWANLVRCEEVALAEGMSQYTGALWMEYKYGDNAILSLLKNGFNTTSTQFSWYYFYDLCTIPESDLPIGINIPGKVLTLHSLANSKGYFAYHMLREEIGKNNFFKGLKNIVKKFKNKKIKLEEFKKEMELVSKKDLDYFFNQWFYKKGAPEFKLKYEVEKINNGYKIKGKISQTGDVYTVNSEIGLLTKDGYDVRKIKIKDRDTDFSYILKTKPEDVVFDPFYKILRWTPELRNIKDLIKIKRLIAVHKYKRAEEFIGVYLKKAPYSFDGKLALAKVYLETKRYKMAEAQYRKIINLYNKYHKGYFSTIIGVCKLGLGKVFDLSGNREKAVSYYKQVVNESIEHPDTKKGAVKYLKTKFKLAKSYHMKLETLKQYEGKYELQGAVFTGKIDEDGVLRVKAPDGYEYNLVPIAKDKFGLVGNDYIIIEFIRDIKKELKGLKMLKNGKIVYQLKKSKKQ